MKKFAWQSALLVIIILLVSLGCRAALKNTYTAYLPMENFEGEPEEYEIKADKPQLVDKAELGEAAPMPVEVLGDMIPGGEKSDGENPDGAKKVEGPQASAAADEASPKAEPGSADPANASKQEDNPANAAKAAKAETNPAATAKADGENVDPENSNGDNPDGENPGGENPGDAEFMALQFAPESPETPGSIELSIHDEDGNRIARQKYYVGRFQTIYDYSTGGFTGDTIVMVALTVFFLGESLLMFQAFRRAKGPSFYAYSTIHMAGFSIFLFMTGLVLLIVTIRHILDPASFQMMDVYEILASSSFNYMIFTSPFMMLFAAGMTVSNVELLRNERPRLKNLLGILISLTLVAGEVLGIYLFMKDFSGAAANLRTLRTLKNAYATVFVYFECMLMGAIICGTIAARHIPARDCDYILILGCSFRKDGSLTPLLRSRVDRAVSFWDMQRKETGKSAVIMPSGGQGANECMAESEAMSRYLLSENFPGDYILQENRSENTYQNMEFSKKLIEERQTGEKVVFATTNYHVFRSGLLAAKAGLPAEGIGSPTKWWFWPNAFMRECIGLLTYRWKEEILLLAIILAFYIVLSQVV